MERLSRIASHLTPDCKTLTSSPVHGGTSDVIVNWEVFKVPPRWVFLRIETKNGYVGWGEPNLEGWSDTVIAAVREMMPSVVGENPARIQYIWQKLHRQKFYAAGGGGVIYSALAGIDQALWDIQGKTLNVPVHRLLGGAVREKLLVYRWCGGDNNTPEAAAKEAKDLLRDSKFKLIKMNACPRMQFIDTEGKIQQAVDRMRAVRNAVGPKVGVGLDFHGRVKAPMAKKLVKALEPFDPLFVEEAVVPDMNFALADLKKATHVPIATGERMFSVASFRDLLNAHAADILQPDCSHCGGISNLLTISRMAEAYDVAMAPHCPLGPIALASCLAVDSVIANFAFQETSYGIHYNAEGGASAVKGKQTNNEKKQCILLHYIKNPQVFEVGEDGCMRVPTGPGLGVEIDEKAVREAAKNGHTWKGREWTLSDGTPTRW